VVDGPFVETKEVIGGYWMLQVKSKEEAIEWASRCPASDNEVIEVRQVQEFADFTPEVQEAASGFRELKTNSGKQSGREGGLHLTGTPNRAGLSTGPVREPAAQL
jgi:hypothetical protein